MKPQKNPNAWSCLPTAFSIVLGISFEEILGKVGHDGSEITHAGLGEPRNRRGFHMQEMVKMCLQMGMSVTPVDLWPQASPVLLKGEEELLEPVRFNTGMWNWFTYNLFTTEGVVECRSMVGNGHALAYQGKGQHAIIYDPAKNDQFTFRIPQDAEQRDRYLATLWRLDIR